MARPHTVSRPPVGGRIPDSTCSSSLWPLPDDARDADDLAGLELEPDIVEQAHATAVDQRQMLGAEQHLALPR